MKDLRSFHESVLLLHNSGKLHTGVRMCSDVFLETSLGQRAGEPTAYRLDNATLSTNHNQFEDRMRCSPYFQILTRMYIWVRFFD